MKRVFTCTLLTCLLLPFCVRAQSQEAMQLALNLQKLSQLRKILTNMKDGYTILTNGYNKVRDIATGNFSLHDGFLSGLLQVSPAVREYQRVALIIRDQTQLVKSYKDNWRQLKASHLFNPHEFDYIARVYERQFRQSLDNLQQLLLILTASQLRMSDAERLTAIDRLYEQMTDQLAFVRYFNQQTMLIGFQRKVESAETKELQKMY